MAFTRFKVSNVALLSKQDPVVLTGKNGFLTSMGTIPILVTNAAKSDLDSNITFTLRGLSWLYDDNYGTHILNVGNSSSVFGALGITHDLVEKINEGVEEGYVSYQPVTSEFTSAIVAYNISADTLKIPNIITQSVSLFDKLPEVPFYAKLYQVLDTRSFGNNTIYVSGKDRVFSSVFNITANTGSYTCNIGYQPVDKKFISVWLDENKLSSSEFSWDSKANITLSLASAHNQLRVRTTIYNTPVIEVGDRISVNFNNVYTVNSTSFSTNSNYNAALTANTFYKIKIDSNLTANVTGFTGVNIYPDLYGTVGNINSTAQSFTVDYNDFTYPGIFDLKTIPGTYKLLTDSTYRVVELPNSKTIEDVNEGPFSIRAYNINTSGRRSPVSSKTILLEPVRLPAITDLSISESLYYDTTQGVSSRATISFTHIINKQISEYELSYKLGGEATDLTSFNTVKLPSSGVANDGKIYYTINNLDRGRTQGVNILTIRIVALNKDIVGVPREYTHNIIGKSAPPSNVANFNAGQNGSNLNFFWEITRKSDGTVLDLDLQEIEIRRFAGQLDSSLYLVNWGTASLVAIVAVPSTSFSYTLPEYGTFTYLIKTRDTSGNESLTVKGLSLTVSRPANLSAFKVWSEDNPSANNVVTGLNNDNYTENYWPSFNDVNNGGFYIPSEPSTLAENANGSSSGFSVAANVTDLTATANAYYITQVRDIGSVLQGKLSTQVNAIQSFSISWNSLKQTLFSGVSDTTATSNIVYDSGSFLGALLTSNNATYDSTNKTLISGGASGNIYAIWNDGQFVGDISNANSFALIAGVINSHAIALGNTFFANGRPSYSNVLANIGASSYKLVNLTQWSDPDAALSWLGPDSVVTSNVELRYSTENVYYQTSNANVNASAFTSGAAFSTYSGGEITFRWFQAKFNINNSDPALVSTLLDKLNYTIDLNDKAYTAAIQVTSNAQMVDYTSEQFKAAPIITLQPIITSQLRVNNTFPILYSSNLTHASISVVTNTGAFISGVVVNFNALGY